MRYEKLIGRAETEDVGGIAVHVAALDDVIASKEWTESAEGPGGRSRVLVLMER